METERTAEPEESGRTGKRAPRASLLRVNFRVFLFCALGLAFGIFLYTKIRFFRLKVTDFLFLAFFLFFALQPYGKKRLIALGVCMSLFMGAGVLGIHIYTQQYLSGAKEGNYYVEGVVLTQNARDGQANAVLTSLTLDGRSYRGKMSVTLSLPELEIGDILSFEGKVMRNGLPSGSSYSSYCFESDLRYVARVSSATVTGKTGNGLLRLKATLYNTLHSRMGRDEADLSFALLTGDSGGMDAGLKEAVQRGGIAHIFAVSGLHIGIVYAAVALLSRPLGKYSALPALGVAFLYSAFCGFTVSSLRAVLMCAVLSVNKLLGRKTDFLQSISLAAVIVLLFLPAQWLSAGFRLSFGACLGLALFSGPLSRLLKKWKCPKFLADYLSASLAVQLFTLPVVLESFNFFPVWGMLLNFVLIPALPFIFLGLLVAALLSLIIPPAAGVFLFLPSGVISLLPFLFSAVNLSFVLTGFSLGAAGVVWLTGSVAFSEKLRLKPLVRGVMAGCFAVLFALCVLMENTVFSGCKITVETNGSGSAAALIQTKKERVLVIGEASLSRCENFLAGTYGGELDAVVVLSSGGISGINTGVFLPAKEVRACDEIPTGLQTERLVFGEQFSVGSLQFRYESGHKLFLFTEGRAVEFDFEAAEPLGEDLFVQKESGGLKYFLKDGIIKRI